MSQLSTGSDEPARRTASTASRDFPTPPGPTSVTRRCVSKSSLHLLELRHTTHERADRNGQAVRVATLGAGAGGSSSGSWARIAASSRRSSGPGSMPSSSPRTVRGGLEGAERVGLATRAVQSQHLLRAETLPQRMLRDQGVDLRRDQIVQSEGKLGLEPQLQGARLELLQPHAVALRELLVDEVRQRRAPPQLQCLAQHGRGSVGVPLGQEPAPLGNKTLETHRVDCIRTKPK